MANRKISDLTALTAPATGDLLPIVDISEAAAADKNKKITYGELLASAPAGSAAAPSFSFDGDPNSGLYSAGADQVAISTNGTGRLFVDASGRVGVGTASPGQTFDVAGTIAQTVGGTTRLRLENTSVGTYYDIRNDGNLYVTEGGIERLRITSAGLVGVGSSSPGYQLEVSSGATDATALFNSTAAQGSHVRFGRSGTVDGYFGCATGFLTSGTSAGDIGIRSQGALVLGSGGNNNRLFITAAGLVGIGTTSPASALTISTTGTILSGTGNTYGLYINPLSSGYVYIDALASSTSNTSLVLRTYNNGVYNNLIQSISGNETTFSTGGTERARIDSSGRLLVGTSTSALEKLVVLGDGGGIQINRNQTGTPTSGQALGSIGFKGVVSANSNAAAEVLIQASADENHSGSTAGSRLEFHTKASGVGPGSSPTERMRITSNGDVLFATQTINDLGTLSLTFNPANKRGITFKQTTNVNSPNPIRFLNAAGTAVGNIITDASTTAYNTSSDYRLKENIIPLTGATDRFNQLQVHRFNFIADPDKTVDGFIAHEVQAVVPEAITGEKDAVDDDGNPVYQGIDQSKLVPLLTAALQEAIAKIESLEARLTAAGI